MRQAISTKYLGPTNFRGSRVKATCQAGSLTLSWDDALNVDDNHNAAAAALALKLEWVGRWVGGGLPHGTGNVYVWTDAVDRADAGFDLQRDSDGELSVGAL